VATIHVRLVAAPWRAGLDVIVNVLMLHGLNKLHQLVAARSFVTVLRAVITASIDACRSHRFVINTLMIDSPSPAQDCGWRTAWRMPTKRRFMNALQRQFGSVEDFRRRATSIENIEEILGDFRGDTTILLASASTLDDEQVRQFLLTKAAAGQLQLAYPGDVVAPKADRVVVLCGIEADADGQACLLNLNRRGIACAWLSANEVVPLEDVPLKEACSEQAQPVAGANTIELSEVPLFHGLPAPQRVRQVVKGRPLRVLTYRWHVPHQYELFKLGAEFTLITDLGEGSCRWWDLGQRPLPPNARFAHWRNINQREFDIAILHFDENVLNPTADTSAVGADWGKTFRFLRQHLTIPQVAVCHGTPQAADRFSGEDAPQQAEASRTALVELLAGVPVVVNSHQAQAEWVFQQSRVIWHGFDPVEFPARPGPPNSPMRILTLPRNALAERPLYRGLDLLDRVTDALNTPMEHLHVAEPNLLLNGNTYARAKFAHYVAALHAFDIYFNPTLHSPMPRSRGEAMLCGLATVNADSHDANLFLENGVNGFISSSAEELAAQLGQLIARPDLARRIGCASRETAIRIFHIDRYLADWRQLIRDTLGNDVL